MCERLPLSKTELKMMFLRVLYEIKYGGKMHDYSNNIDSIVQDWINIRFNIKITDQERQLANEAIQDLKTSGFIVRDSGQHDDVFQVLTKRGKDLVEKQQDPDAYALRLEQVLKNPELLSVCVDSFNKGDYEIAIFKAFRFVEERVRETAHLDAKDIGIELMNRAFSPTTGKLIITTCAVPAEQEGVQSLFRGAISEFKNPSSHRTVNYDDRHIAIQTITFAELLIGILSKAKLRP